MNKKLRSLIAALVALLMVFSLAPAVFAEETTEPQDVSTAEYDNDTGEMISNDDVTKTYDGIAVTNEDEDVEYQVALSVKAYEESTATVDVSGDVVSTNPYGYADGLYAEAYAGGTTEVHVGGDVVSDGGYDTWTTYFNAGEDSTVNVTIDGSLTGSSEDGSIMGLYVQGAEGSINVTVGEDVSVTGGSEDDFGYAGGVFVNVKEGCDVEIAVGGDVTATAEAENGYATGIWAAAEEDSSVQITVDGNVTSSTPGTEDSSYGVNTNSRSGGDVQVTVAGDVSSNSVGVYLSAEASDEDAALGTAAVTIGGTLSCEESIVVLNEANTVEDIENGNVALTVWQVELAEGQENIVNQWAYDEEEDDWTLEYTDAAEALEKAIRYIIKLEQPQEGAALSVTGAQKEGDYDVALEGDTVTLNVDVADGYALNAAYNGLGQKVLLVKDASGNYFVVVPKCGGVYLSVDLSRLFVKALLGSSGFTAGNGAIVYFNLFEDSTYELICGGMYDRGAYSVENGEIKLISGSGVEMPVAEDGSVTYVFANGYEVEMTLPAELLSKLLAA